MSLSKVPQVVYQEEDVILELEITLYGDSQTDLSGTTSKFGLMKKPIEDDSTNDLSVSGSIVSGTPDKFKYEITDTATKDLDPGTYRYVIEFVKDAKKYIVSSGYLEIRRGVFQ